MAPQGSWSRQCAGRDGGAGDEAEKEERRHRKNERGERGQAGRVRGGTLNSGEKPARAAGLEDAGLLGGGSFPALSLSPGDGSALHSKQL